MKFNLMMHNALMVERTMLGVEDYEIPANLEELTINQKPFFQNAKNIFYTLEQFYRIEISNWELYVIYEILSSRWEGMEKPLSRGKWLFLVFCLVRYFSLLLVTLFFRTQIFQ